MMLFDLVNQQPNNSDDESDDDFFNKQKMSHSDGFEALET